MQNCPPGCCIVTHLGAARRPQPCCTIAHGAAKSPTWALQDAPALLHHGPRGWPQPCCGVAHLGAATRPQPAAKLPTWVLQKGPNMLQTGPPGCCKTAPISCKMAHLGAAKRPQPAAKRCSFGRLYEGGQFVYFVRPKQRVMRGGAR
jgi:hypothetical protein